MVGWLFFLIIFLLIAGFSTYATLSTKKALADGKETMLMKLWEKDSSKSVASSLISIVLGLLVGCLILILMAIFPSMGAKISFKTVIDGIQLVFAGIFNTGKENIYNIDRWGLWHISFLHYS